MTQPPVVVRQVRDGRTAREFRELPYRLYRSDRNWVPPLRRLERQRWSRGNPALRERTAVRFIAARGVRTVGRIAAILDPLFSARWQAGTGFFGCYECEADEGAAAALFAAAERALRGMGCQHVLGPVNLSTHEEVGFLAEGHESPPAFLSPYNPPWYLLQAEAAGYTPAREYASYLWTPDLGPDRVAQRALRRVAGRAADSSRVAVRPSTRKRWRADTDLIFGMYNEAFADVWGFVPLRRDEFDAMAATFRSFYRPELVLIAEVGGEPAGFGLMLPDINAALRPLKGRLLPFGWLHLARTVPYLRTGRMILLGVRPPFTGHGLAPLIGHTMAERARHLGFHAVEMSIVQAGNSAMRHVIDAFGGRPCKRYVLYGRSLPAATHELPP